MTERDRLEAMAEALEWAGTKIETDVYAGYPTPHEIRVRASELRALAEQRTEAVEPVAWRQRYIDPEEGPSIWSHCDENSRRLLQGRTDYEVQPLYTHPQAGAPAEPVIDGYPLSQGIPPAPAADLDALVARCPDINLFDCTSEQVEALNVWAGEAVRAITDLRAQKNTWKALAEDWSASADAAQQPEKFYEEYNEKSMRAMQALLTKAKARITRLEVDNAKARELLEELEASVSRGEGNYTAIAKKIKAFLAKQGD